MNELNQFCATLLEDVSGDVFEPHAFDTSLFPELSEGPKLEPMDSTFSDFTGLSVYGDDPSIFSPGPLTPSSASIFGDFPEHAYLLSPTIGPESSPWDAPDDQSAPVLTPSVRKPSPIRNTMLANRMTNPFCVSLPLLHKPEVKIESKEEEPIMPTVSTPETRLYTNMNNLTRQNETGRTYGERSNHVPYPMMLMRIPQELKLKHRTEEEKPKTLADAQKILEAAPEVPKTPLAGSTNGQQAGMIASDDKQALSKDSSSEQESDEGDAIVPSSASPGSASKFESYIRRARASRAAVEEAARTESTGSTNTIDSVAEKLARTHIRSERSAPRAKPSVTRPVMEGGLARKMKAAKAQTLCSRDPQRKRHAELVVELMKGIYILQRRLKQAQVWNTSQSMYPQAATSTQKENQQSATRGPLTDLGYSHLRSALEDSKTPDNTEQDPPVLDEEPITADSPVIYPISEIHRTSAAPFELSEEERRFIEEDNAKTAAEAAVRSKEIEGK